jgi:hypothetical protein
LVEPSGPYSRAARKGLLASKRVSLAAYNESLAACKRNMTGVQHEDEYPGIYMEI